LNGALKRAGNALWASRLGDDALATRITGMVNVALPRIPSFTRSRRDRFMISPDFRRTSTDTPLVARP
jgi:hypothetical protein